MDKFDVYKVETVNNTWLIASGEYFLLQHQTQKIRHVSCLYCQAGLPRRNGDRHAEQICNMALKMQSEGSGIIFCSFCSLQGIQMLKFPLHAVLKISRPDLPRSAVQLKAGAHTGTKQPSCLFPTCRVALNLGKKVV